MNSKATKKEFSEEDLLFHFASFFKFMHAKVSVTCIVTFARPRSCVKRKPCFTPSEYSPYPLASTALATAGIPTVHEEEGLCCALFGEAARHIDVEKLKNGAILDAVAAEILREHGIDTVIGLHIKYGANSGSSDADIRNVHIVGAGTAESVGVLVEGFDNTFTDMRIANVLIGFDIRSRGNFLRNIHPLFTLDFAMFDQSCGFYDHAGNNWFDMCYSDNFCMSFRESEESIGGMYNSCFCFWYSSKGEKHIAHKCDGAFLSVVTNLKSDFKDRESKNLILEAEQEGGKRCV